MSVSGIGVNEPGVAEKDVDGSSGVAALPPTGNPTVTGAALVYTANIRIANGVISELAVV